MEKENIFDKTDELNELSMEYETMAVPFFEEDYLSEFYEFYEIKDRSFVLKDADPGFYRTLREVSGFDVWEPIAAKTEDLFGIPLRIKIFEDPSKVTEALSGYNDGLSGFYVVFDIMFCEYGDFTLCFISGSNN